MPASEDPHLEEAVRSIYAFIRRTAQPGPTGVGWTTIDYENRPHHDVSVFNGVGGIPFFLADYHRHYHAREALDLARGAVVWCMAFPGKHYTRGLHLGLTGAALGSLRIAEAAGDTATPPEALDNAALLAREPPGPVTDLLGGAASNGLFLLRLWERTRSDAHLAAARRCATWLEGVMIRDEHGTHCRVAPGGELDFGRASFLGVAHGIAGVAHFLLLLARASQEERWATLARELLDTLERHARPVQSGLNWPGAIGRVELTRCQWSHGAAGIGLVFHTAHRVLGEMRHLHVALACAEATYAYGDLRHNPTQCTGLAGGGELLLETYRSTGDSRWLERAREFALACLHYRETTPEGDAWPTDAPGLHSADFDYGAAGTGHFLLRVLSRGTLSMPCM